MSSEPALKVVATDTAQNAESGASVDKIRDILFGSQIKNYEARFARLEEALAREASDLRDTMKRRLDSLEGFFKKETEALATRLKAEREERMQNLQDVSRELKASSDALTKRLIELDNKTADSDSGLRHELMAESRKLLDEIRQRNEDLAATVDRRVKELRFEKADRSTIAALLTEMALQIDEEIAQPALNARAAKSGNQG